MRTASDDDVAKVNGLLFHLLEGLRWLGMLLHPFMPERTAELWRQLGVPGALDADWSVALARWGDPKFLPPGTTVTPGDPLFPRVELVSA
jgi:methionyl-tRNA synthetase